jgi:peptide/nickel transport system permease protein
MAVRGGEAEPGALALEPEMVLPRRPGFGLKLLRTAIHKPLGTFGVIVIIIMAVAAALCTDLHVPLLGVEIPGLSRYEPEAVFRKANPLYTPDSFDPEALSPTTLDRQAAPTMDHWFGTDSAGRDVWSRVIIGARRSLGIGIGALSIATVVGAFLGVLSAYFGGRFDTLLQRVLDAIQAFPALLLLILITSVTEPKIQWLIIGLGFVGITQVSRIVRGTVLSLREQPYVEAARVIGANDLRLMAVHILPNTMAPIIVVFTIGLGSVIIAEASLSFLGLAPPGVSWGQMLNEGRNFIYSSPWQAVFSGLAITLAVLAFNLAGDALRDIMDPRLRV